MYFDIVLFLWKYGSVRRRYKEKEYLSLVWKIMSALGFSDADEVRVFHTWVTDIQITYFGRMEEPISSLDNEKVNII